MGNSKVVSFDFCREYLFLGTLPYEVISGKISARLLAEFSHGTPQNRLLSVKRDFHEPAIYLAILDADIWRVKYRQFTPRSATKIAKCLPSISGLS